MHYAGKKFCMLAQFWIIVTHDFNDFAHCFVKKSVMNAHQGAEAQSPADKAAQHVSTSLVGRQNPVGDHKCGCSAMVGYNTQGSVNIIGVRGRKTVCYAGKIGRILDDVLKQVAVEV